MTAMPSGPLRLTYADADADADDTVRIELRGDLDHHCADLLLDAVTRLLAGRPRPRDLHLDCSGLAATDSSGLSALLMVRRHTDAAGVRLHLDGRPAHLDRLLELTGTLEHLTAPDAGGRSGSFAPQRQHAASDAPLPARASGPDTTV